MPKTLDPKKVEKLAGLLSFSIDRIEAMLGVVDDELLAEIRKASTIEQTKRVFGMAPLRGEGAELAMEKWLSFCSTIEQAKEAFNSAPERGEAQKLAMEKWLSFCFTIEQAEGAYNATLRGSRVEKLALKKMYDLIY